MPVEVMQIWRVEIRALAICPNVGTKPPADSLVPPTPLVISSSFPSAFAISRSSEFGEAEEAK